MRKRHPAGCEQIDPSEVEELIEPLTTTLEYLRPAKCMRERDERKVNISMCGLTLIPTVFLFFFHII